MTSSDDNLLDLLPLRHRRVIENPDDPIHNACDFLLAITPHELLDLQKVNRFLHSQEFDPWPKLLIAFASNGCGDYYAYDQASALATIIYIDPGLSVAENLASRDCLRFASFDAWYIFKVRHKAPKS